jgi:hypothetical protein
MIEEKKCIGRKIGRVPIIEMSWNNLPYYHSTTPYKLASLYS